MRASSSTKSARSGSNRLASKRRAARSVLERPAAPPGWLTTDETEIDLRRWRGRTEILSIAALDPGQGLFGTFQAHSASGGSYDVEIRSLEGFTNSCGCIDHRVNGLGTCKHIEGVLAALRRQGVRAFRAASAEGNPRAEVFLDRAASSSPTIVWPERGDRAELAAARRWLAPFLTPDGLLASEPATIESLLAAWAKASPKIHSVLRVSGHFGAWLDRWRRERRRVDSRDSFEAELASGGATLDVLRHALLPYQREGVLHLAFGERALLADDMGLGKTIQAIGACELLSRREDIRRVLVVCPASLKAEWEEQIARFTDRPTRLVFGNRAARLAAYNDAPFFTVANYEQILIDADDINTTLRPDVVILDEAQRIKNWQTKTARRIKSLRSPYAFVLTGTPIENRIDEIYSIVQYLDPEILGPLFRFNRDFYQLDERGRPVDYKNLADLRQRLQPVLLRRRKADVEKQLPGRTIKTYFVAMAEEQRLRYEDYRVPAAQIIARAQRRPLTQAEFDRLQQLLACMRMVCDTPFILDPTCKVCPKLEELEGILEDLLEDPDRKIIVFSEWERMLGLVRELAGEMGVDTAWHTGSVPQQRRRLEINRFQNDPACRLFLSTDSGSVGLNLQGASAVINIDLPWNPAKLEQRIARAWRKNQIRSVSVVNLVTEDSIEHSIMHLLGRKQALADGVLDGSGDLDSIKMPSGRAALIERMQAMMEAKARVAAPPVVPPEEEILAELRRLHTDRLLRVELRTGADGEARLLAVLDLDEAALTEERTRLAAEDGGIEVELIDRGSWLAMRRLAATGLVQFTGGPSRILHQAAGAFAEPTPSPVSDAKVTALKAQADRALRMAGVLAAGGFAEEAPALLAQAFERATAARLALKGLELDLTTPVTEADIQRSIGEDGPPAEALTLWNAIRTSGADPAEARITALLAETGRFIGALS